MKKKLGIFGFIIFSIIFLIFYLNIFIARQNHNTIITIPKGAGYGSIASALHASGIVKMPIIMKIYAILLYNYGYLNNPKYGEYEIEKGATINTILKNISDGKVKLYRITFTDGLTNMEFMDIIKSSDFLEKDILNFDKEGYLMPDTYFVTRGTLASQLIKEMNTATEIFLNEAWKNRAENLKLKNQYETLVLASIIEREAKFEEERSLISSVYHNRLNIQMKLQADPTLIYQITKGRSKMNRALTRNDLQKPGEYNTYLNYGLPPTPIANPSRASILAALHPAKTNYIYFVADATGGHKFSQDYKIHIQNIQSYKQSLAKQNNEHK